LGDSTAPELIMDDDDNQLACEGLNGTSTSYAVGFKRPPLHSRFKAGASGNPAGRPKGSQNLRTLFEKILKEQISLREGAVTKKISKAEAILRGLVIGAMKGDARSQVTLFKLAETTGQFDTAANSGGQHVTFTWLDPEEVDGAPPRHFPSIRQDKSE